MQCISHRTQTYRQRERVRLGVGRLIDIHWVASFLFHSFFCHYRSYLRVLKKQPWWDTAIQEKFDVNFHRDVMCLPLVHLHFPYNRSNGYILHMHSTCKLLQCNNCETLRHMFCIPRSYLFSVRKKLIQNYINSKVYIPGLVSVTYIGYGWSKMQKPHAIHICMMCNAVQWQCHLKIHWARLKAINVVDSLATVFSQIDGENGNG